MAMMLERLELRLLTRAIANSSDLDCSRYLFCLDTWKVCDGESTVLGTGTASR